MKPNVLLSVVFVVVRYFALTSSLAVMSNKFVKMTTSNGASVCSNELPSQALSMNRPTREVMMCGGKCSASDMCTYFQLNLSTASSQCQLYDTLPVNFTNIESCVGFVYDLNCPDGWTRRGKRCYTLAVGRFQSWNLTEDYCSAFNTPLQSHLINIESDEELKLMMILVSELIPTITFATTTSSVNLALQQPTWQSSTFEIYTSGAAVDGNKDTIYCAITDNDPSPWFAVDLGKPTDVYGAGLTNRNSDPEREDNFLVGLTNNPPLTMPPTTNGYITCGQWPGSAPASATMFVKCADNLPPARYVVIIQQYQTSGYLQICELEVFGKDVFTRHSVNLALNRPTWQSSNYVDDLTSIRYSWYAVDGNYCTNLNQPVPCCSCTLGSDVSSWLAVDLGEMTYVYGAAVTNRDRFEFRANNFLVGLTNNPPLTMPPTTNGYTTCGQWPGSAPASATMFVKCADNLPPARYVVIIQQYQPSGYFVICELEVYGKAFVWLKVVRNGRTSTYQQSQMLQLQTYNWGYGSPVATGSCLAMDVYDGTVHDTQCIAPNGTAFYAICESP